MPLTPAEAKRAAQIEEMASKRELTGDELNEYHALAALSHRRAVAERMKGRK